MLIACRVQPEVLDALYDGELRGLRAHWLREHVALCSQCQEYLANAARIRSLLSQTQCVEPPADFSQRVIRAAGVNDGGGVLARVAADLQAPASLGGAQFTSRVMSRVSQVQRNRSRPLTWVAVGAAAVVIVITVALTIQHHVQSDPTDLVLRNVSFSLRRIERLFDPTNWLASRTARGIQTLRQKAAETAECDLGEQTTALPEQPAPSCLPQRASPGP